MEFIFEEDTTMIKKEIIDRIIKLGGTFDFNGQSLQSDIESIHFNKSYLEKEFEEYLQDEVFDRIKEEGVISETEINYPRITFQTKLFTPFTDGTADYNEWNGCLDEDIVRSFIAGDLL